MERLDKKRHSTLEEEDVKCWHLEETSKPILAGMFPKGKLQRDRTWSVTKTNGEWRARKNQPDPGRTSTLFWLLLRIRNGLLLQRMFLVYIRPANI